MGLKSLQLKCLKALYVQLNITTGAGEKKPTKVDDFVVAIIRRLLPELIAEQQADAVATRADDVIEVEAGKFIGEPSILGAILEELDDEDDGFYPVSPQRHRHKAWATPKNTDRNMKLGMEVDKENLKNFVRPSMNRSQLRKGQRYDYYQRRLKLRSENAPQRVDPNLFI